MPNPTYLSVYMKRKPLRILLLIVGVMMLNLIPDSAWSQINYVKNPSFEDGIPSTAPIRTVGFSACKPWFALVESPDWFRDNNNSSVACYDDCYAGNSLQQHGSANVPYNVLGFQNAYQGGRAYAGIWGGKWFVENGQIGSGDKRSIFELMAQEMEYTLVAGETYTVSFRISRAEASNIALKNVGLYFSKVSPQSSSFNLSSLLPGAISTNWVTDKSDWVLIQNSYTAVGGEKWVVLGDVPATIIKEGQSPLQLQYGVHWIATEPGENTCKMQCPLVAGPDMHGCIKDLRGNPSQDGCRIAYYYFDDVKVIGPQCHCSNMKITYVPKYISPYSNSAGNCCFSVYVHNPDACPYPYADAVSINIGTSGQYQNPLEDPFISSASGTFSSAPSVFNPAIPSATIRYTNPVGGIKKNYLPGSTTYIGDFCVKMPESGQLTVSPDLWQDFGDEYGGHTSCGHPDQQISCSIEPCCDFIKAHFNRVDPCHNPYKHEIVFDTDMPEGMLPCNFVFVKIRRSNTTQSLVPVSNNTNWALIQSSASELKYSYSGVVQPNGTYNVGVFNISKAGISYTNEPIIMDLLDANGKLICSKLLWLDCFIGDEFDCDGHAGTSKNPADRDITSINNEKNTTLLSVDPNPVSTGEVSISFELIEKAQIRLELYDMNGKLVRVLADEEQQKGNIKLQCKTDDLLTGTYYVKLNYNNQVISVPLQVIR